VDLDHAYSLMGLLQLAERDVVKGELVYDLIEFVNEYEVSSKVFGDVLIGIVNEGKPYDIFKHL
jgi:hypothetical protein